MPVSSYIRIPNLYTPSPLHAALSGLMGGMEQSRAAQQQQEQMDLQRQLAEMKQQQLSQQMEQAKVMGPLQQQQLQAQIEAMQAKAAELPGQQALAEQKHNENLAKNILTINAQDPNYAKSNPGQVAWAMNVLQQATQPQAAPQVMGLQAQQFTQQPEDQAPSLPPAYQQAIESAAAAKKGKEVRAIYPEQQIQRISRINAAKERFDEASDELNEILPYLEAGQSVAMIAENLAKATGMPVRDANIKVKTFFDKTIKGIAKELAPAMGIPTTEKAQEQFFKYFDPSSFGSPQQVLANWHEVGKMINSVGKQIAMTPEQQIAQTQKLFQNVPREKLDMPQDNQISYKGKSYSREDLERIAGRGK
jgi:hypothetical protein